MAYKYDIDNEVENLKQRGLTPTEIHVGADLYHELTFPGRVAVVPAFGAVPMVSANTIKNVAEYKGIPLVKREDQRIRFLEVKHDTSPNT